jgi:transcriptional regulator with XRE-family HTH domain
MKLDGKKSKNIRMRMFELGISQVELSDKMGMSQSSVSNKLAGRYGWKLDEVYKLMKALELPLSMIYEYFPDGDVENHTY